MCVHDHTGPVEREYTERAIMAMQQASTQESIVDHINK